MFITSFKTGESTAGHCDSIVIALTTLEKEINKKLMITKYIPKILKIKRFYLCNTVKVDSKVFEKQKKDVLKKKTDKKNCIEKINCPQKKK